VLKQAQKTQGTSLFFEKRYPEWFSVFYFCLPTQKSDTLLRVSEKDNVKVTRGLIKKAVSINQTEYVTEIVKKFFFDDNKTYSTLMNSQTI